MLALLGGAALVVGLWPRAESSGLPPQGGGQGAAIVVNVRLASSPELPNLNDLVADPAGVAAAFEARGLDVVTDPTERCLALLSPAQLPADPAELGGLSSPALAAVILAYATPEQMASCQRGYLQAGTLSSIQRAAAQEVRRRHRLFDARLGVAAQDIAVRTLLWAVQVALGPEVVLRCEAAEGRVAVTYSSEADPSWVGDRPRPVWRGGYYNPSASAVGCAACHGNGILHASTRSLSYVRRNVPERICPVCHDSDHSPKF
ncbi:MAG: hypothetical protein ACE5JM_16195, partial [Armatimonadota bacterium]